MSDDAELLVPPSRWQIRLVLWLCFAAFVAIGQAPLMNKLLICAFMGLSMGLLPSTTIHADKITRGWSIFAWKIHTQELKLRRFIRIDTGSDEDVAAGDPTGILNFLLFGVWPLFWPIFGWFLPWVGGPYRLSLRDFNDERVTVWQGSREAHFRENLATLERRTGLPIGPG